MSSSQNSKKIQMDRVIFPKLEYEINIKFDHEIYRCQLCKNLAINLVLCKDCGSSFCKSCIQEWVQAHEGKCACESVYMEAPLQKKRLEILNQIKIKCGCTGCEEILSYDSIIVHEESKCQYRNMLCKCGKTYIAKDEKLHKNECDEEEIPCQFCNTKILRKQINLHNEKCEEKPVTCEYCKTGISKKNLNEHKIKCPELPNTCKECLETIPARLKSSHNCYRVLANQIKEIENEYMEISELRKKFYADSDFMEFHQKLLLGRKRKLPENSQNASAGIVLPQNINEENKQILADPIPDFENYVPPKKKAEETHIVRIPNPDKPQAKNMVPYCPNCHTPGGDFIGNEHCAIMHKITKDEIWIQDLKNKSKNTISYSFKFKREEIISSVLVRSIIYISGGKLGTSYLKSTESFEIHSNTVKQLSDMNQQRYFHKLIAINENYIMAVGGKLDNSITKTCELYSINQNKWELTSSLNHAENFIAVCNISHKFLYLLGKNDILGDTFIERFDITKPELIKKTRWESIGQFPSENSEIYIDSFELNDSEILLLADRTVYTYNYEHRSINKITKLGQECDQIPIVKYQEDYAFVTKWENTKSTFKYSEKTGKGIVSQLINN